MLTKTISPKTKDAVLFIAEQQIGIVEVPANSNKVKYNNDYYGRTVSGSAYPWCMAFVWWVFREACFNLYKTASCSSFVNRYKSVSPKQIVKENFQAGDIVFFDFSGKKVKTEHVGIIESVKDGFIVTIEGNTSANGSQSNGGAVLRKQRDLSLVTCAVRPTYK